LKTIPTQLLQRGVEGIITIVIGRHGRHVLRITVVFVDLPNSKFPEPITNLKRQRLAAMGEAAAHSMVGNRGKERPPHSHFPRSRTLVDFYQPENRGHGCTNSMRR